MLSNARAHRAMKNEQKKWEIGMLFSSGVLLLIYLPWFCAQCVKLTVAVINMSAVS